MIQITSSFPGGNILVDRIEGNIIHLRQDRRDTAEWWFYWCFHITGTAGRRLIFNFGDGNVFTSEGPCFSRDGESWRWLGAQCTSGDSFAYTFGPGENEAWFALTHPYTERNLLRFLAGAPRLRRSQLVQSEQGRSVDLLEFRAKCSEGAVIFTCRTHACEAQASHALEGIMEYWLNDVGEGRHLRDRLDLVVVPFVDKDGVERGDQGKNRTPHDHNRDFNNTPRYASSAALMRLVDADPRRWRAAFDLHCPWIRHAENETIFLVEGPATHVSAQRRFAATLESIRRGPLPFFARDNFPFGHAWNQDQADTFIRHVREMSPCPLAATFEIPYAKANNVTVTPQSAREFGHDLGRALARELFATSS